jgi:6-phosphogluconolactonase (cycloisomerase 2 family)
MVTDRTTPGLLTLLSSHIVANQGFNLVSGGNMVNTTDDKFLYMTNGSTVNSFEVNTSNGSLSNLPSVTFQSQLLSQLRITSDNRYLYAAQANGVVAMFRVNNSTGGLTPLSPATIDITPPGGREFTIRDFAVTPDDKHVYFLTYSFRFSVDPSFFYRIASITVCDVESTTGNLVVNNQLTVDLTGNPSTRILLSRDGQFAYVLIDGGASINMYSIATNGGLNPLSPASTTPDNIDGQNMVTSFDDNYLYVVKTGEMIAYERNSATGLLSSIQTIDMPFSASSMVASADSIYALGNRGQLIIYAINGNGTLQFESQFTTGTGGTVQNFIFLNNNGKFIYINNKTKTPPNNTVDIFGVN